MATSSLQEMVKGFHGEPSDLVPALQRVQESEGYLSCDLLSGIARWLRLSESEVYGVATFYAQFRFTRAGGITSASAWERPAM